MSKKPEKSKLRQPSTVSNFINNENKDSTEDPDDSLKYFKFTKPPLKRPQSSKGETSSAVSNFYNKSPPKKVAKKSSPKKGVKGRKKNLQPDIRKLLTKDEQLVHNVLEKSCRDDDIDPDDYQLAIALSESMKEEKPKSDLSTFENPFKSSGKVLSVNSVLERFGFKSGKSLTDYEQDLLTSNKFSKRSKFQKAPTLLTRTSSEEREKMIETRVNEIIDNETFNDKKDQVTIDFDVYSSLLQDVHMQMNSITRLDECEVPCDEIVERYYVTDLFQPSFLQPDHLLKDWGRIPGRDKSPEKMSVGVKADNEDKGIEDPQVQINPEDVNEKSPQPPDHEAEATANKENSPDLKIEEEKNFSINSSISDIFADVESFKIDPIEDESHVSQQLEILHEKLSNTRADDDLEFEDERSFHEKLCDDDDPMDGKENSIMSKIDDWLHEKSTYKHSNPNISINVESDSDHTIEYEPEASFKDPQATLAPPSPMQIDLLSSDDDKDPSDICDLTQDHKSAEITPNQSSENEVIELSDDEINYSMNVMNDEPKADEFEVFEIDNIGNNENSPQQEKYDDFDFNNLLNETSMLLQSPAYAPRDSTKSNQSMQKFLNEEKFSDSLQEILKKYAPKKSDTPKRGSFRKYQSESSFKLDESKVENFVDLTQNLSDEVNEALEENSGDFVNEVSINKSLANIINSPAVVKPRKSLRKSRKSLLSGANEKFLIDTENEVPEPDFKNMTPAELKQELFKYGIRPLPVKKATELLQHIYNSIHPKIRVAAEGEIDENDSRRELNNTDIVSNIACTGDDDDFVFQYEELEGEEFFMPKSRKSKISTCLMPLQIAFYNMIRSNPKLQQFILEFRPLDLDLIHKHFRKFDLTYQLNDIIMFLDRRCITFKTKDKSYSKTHEAKKQKRLKRSQRN